MRHSVLTRWIAAGALVAAAALVPALAEGDKPEVGYDKGLFFKTDSFELKFGGRLQLRYTNSDPDGPDNTMSEFKIRRAKFFLTGYAYKPWLKYKVQFNTVGSEFTDTKGNKTEGFLLEDFFVDFAKNRHASVRAGQYKVPFGIQELTSSGAQQFVDRSITSDEFAPSRDQGVELFGDFFKNRTLAYDLGVFNGNGLDRKTNDNNQFEYVARVHLDPAGPYKLEESATDNPDKVLWTIGAGWLLNKKNAASAVGSTGPYDDVTSLEGFFALKYKRFSAVADYYARTMSPDAGVDVDSNGYIAQVGWFFVPKKFEVALRAAQIDPNTDSASKDDKKMEGRIAFNYFMRAHYLKLQADLGRIRQEDPAGNMDTNEARVQFQIIF